MSQWTPFPKRVPDKSGYYLISYYCFERQSYYCKPVFWIYDHGWVGWRANGGPVLSKVKCFAPETRHDYYMPCHELSKKIKERPLCSNT
jgi:hypothetical protein